MKLIKYSMILLGMFTITANAQSPITISVNQNASKSDIVRYAANELLRNFQQLGGQTHSIQLNDVIINDKNIKSRRGNIELSIVSELKENGVVEKATPESFQISAKTDGSVSIIGVDAEGALWGVRDFIHYYAKEWYTALQSSNPMVINVKSSPTIQNRGLWSWWHGCWDPYGYVDRASEWKLNVITFWNRGVPMDAERLNAYAHQRGVRIWWGFSWGWVADDFKDASPALAKRLLAIYERQKKEIGPGLNNLCPYDAETPQALMDYVLDVYDNQYSWIPNIDGIYFQTATESTCPCPKCKATPRGEGFIRTTLPIIKELHKRYPKLLISCGVHNTGNIETFKALKQIPDYCNICWEDGVTWAPNREIALDQMTYRGINEDFAGVYRITMNCGLDVRGTDIRNEPARVWLPRIEKLWDYLEEGQPEGSSKGFKTFFVQGKEVGNPCTSDWRPKPNEKLIENKNFNQLLTWSRDLATSNAKTKGVFLLVEAGLIDLKMRRVPAMAAEVIWNPLINEEELEQRTRMIWEKNIGGWNEPLNPFWNTPITETDGFQSSGPLQDLGNIYREMGRKEESAQVKLRPCMHSTDGKEIDFELPDDWYAKEFDGQSFLMGQSILVGQANDVASIKTDIKDFEMNLELNIPEGGCVGIVFHYKDALNYDFINFYSDAAKTYYYRRENGNVSVMQHGTIAGGFVNNKWYPVRLKVQGDNLEVFFNGSKTIESKQKMMPSAGRCGFRTETNLAVYRSVNISIKGQKGIWTLETK